MLFLQLFNAYLVEDLVVLKNTMKHILRLASHHLGGTHIMNYFFPLAEGLAGLSLVKSEKK